MKPRKTFDVQSFINTCNDMLANEKLSQEEKRGICTLAEKVLFETNNYKGYSHIGWVKGYHQWVSAGKPDDTTPFIGPEYDRVYSTKLQ